MKKIAVPFVEATVDKRTLSGSASVVVEAGDRVGKLDLMPPGINLVPDGKTWKVSVQVSITETDA